MNAGASCCDKGWFRNVRRAVFWPALVKWRQSMIPEKREPVSDQIMLNKKPERVRAPGGLKGIPA
jgi:hypothetical protein